MCSALCRVGTEQYRTRSLRCCANPWIEAPVIPWASRIPGVGWCLLLGSQDVSVCHLYSVLVDACFRVVKAFLYLSVAWLYMYSVLLFDLLQTQTRLFCDLWVVNYRKCSISKGQPQAVQHYLKFPKLSKAFQAATATAVSEF